MPDADGARAFLPAPSSWKLGVPLAIRAQPRDPATLASELSRRQTVYLVGLVAIVMLMGFGAYFTARVVRQELAVAELKADFVSAVSHEFRSPLTGIRQLGEMLMRGRVTSEERRQEYYERITHESDRLGHLVENLLDFSRMEAGRRDTGWNRSTPARGFATWPSRFRRDVLTARRTSRPAFRRCFRRLLPIARRWGRRSRTCSTTP